MMKGRHEHKFYINYSDYLAIRQRLKIVATADKHTKDNNGYQIRSLYFDNCYDKAVMEKLAGLGRREKFRIRYYNDNIDFMRLEKKSKINRLTYKENTKITAAECQRIIQGDYQLLNDSTDSLKLELYAKMQKELLRPRNIVDYEREVYVYEPGNVRITFDSNIRMSNHIYEFLNPDRITTQAANAIILEVKYDGFLPEVIRHIVQVDGRSQTEFSKYVVARMV